MFSNLSIKGRLISLGAVACFGAVVLAGVSLSINLSLQKSVEQSRQRQEQLTTVNTMRKDTLLLMLSAMDSIIDRDEGRIQPERLDNMQSALDQLARLAPSLQRLADTPEEHELARQVPAMIAGLKTGSRTAGGEDIVFGRPAGQGRPEGLSSSCAFLILHALVRRPMTVSPTPSAFRRWPRRRPRRSQWTYGYGAPDRRYHTRSLLGKTVIAGGLTFSASNYPRCA